MLVVFSPIFGADAKIICGYNFVAPLKVPKNKIKSNDKRSIKDAKYLITATS